MLDVRYETLDFKYIDKIKLNQITIHKSLT
jgi:hypothetical protein